MTTIRVEHNRNYTVIINQAIQDRRLSFKARGMHHLLLSYPDGWKINIKHLESQSDKDARTSVSTALKELEDLGYISREQSRTKNGRIGAIEYVVRELPKINSDNSQKTNKTEPPKQKISGKTVSGKTVSGKTVSGKTVSGKTVSGKSDRILNTNNDQVLKLSNTPPYPPKGVTSVCKENSSGQEEVTEILSSSVDQKKEELNPTHQTLQRIKDSAAPIENGSRYQKDLDGSDHLPWETSKSPRQFEQGFEEWMSKSLSDYPAYQGLINGDLITKVRKHISAGKYDFKRRDELLIEWDAYSASKEDKQLSQPLIAPLYTIRKPPSPEEEAANLLKRRIDQLNAIPEGKKMFIPKWLPGAIKNGEIPVEKVQKWMIQAMEF
ncbi:MAG: hypothetical protein F6J86_16215 [Symploca sp. SIO1B1]|nr:hypothetical protein [Symploca sp. SIO1B1]